MNDNAKAIICTVGLLCITFLEWRALELGINGTYLSACVAAIAGIVGAAIGIKIASKEPPSEP